MAFSTQYQSNTDLNLRPGGGLLGMLRDRHRDTEQLQQQQQQQPPTLQARILNQIHPHMSRNILSSGSILDKDGRSDFRERNSLLNEDRYERRPFNRDRDYGR